MDNIPTSIDITNLPDEILTAVPGISNAVANDKRDDAATLQAVIDWLTNLRAEGFTDAIEIYIPAGVFDFAKTLDINVPNITIRGDGMGLTIVQNSDAFLVGTGNLTDQGIDVNSINRKAYLFDLDKDADNVTFTNITFTGSEIHGAIFAFGADALEIKQSEFNDFAFSSLRPFNISEIKVHDNIFIDAGNRTSQVIGGAIYGTFLGGAEIYNNSIFKTETYEGNFFGIKGRQFKNSLIYNNTIETDFAIELPFENDENVEIYHNFLDGTVSIPKYQGGPVPENGFTFRIHHNYFTKSYSIEVPRNGIEIDHNVFSFDPEQDDTGNLISNFNQDSEPVNGPIVFHNNLILNPGRGIFWSQGPYNNFSFYNNEVIARDTVNFRTEGLFGFNGGTDFSTIEIRDNIIEINGMARPLLRNATGVNAKISNNTLSNISDVAQYANPNTGAQRGLIDSLLFQVGVNGEFNVDGANLSLINGSGSSSINLTADSTSISEKDGIAVVTVNREAGTTGELTVTLLNSDPTAVTVATEVTIPDGEAATSFFIFGVDNTTSDGRRTATIRASVAGLVVDTITFNINDDEPPIATIFKIEAEDYSADYFDTSAGNSGGTSGFTDDVDVSVNPAGGFYVSHIKKDEYLSYDFTVAANGFYDLVVRAATKRDNRSIQVTIDEQSYTVAIPNTGGRETWQDVVIPDVVLNAGTTTMRVDMKSSSFNLDFFEFRPQGELPNAAPTTSVIADVTVIEGSANTVISLFDVFDDAEDADTELTYAVTNNSNADLFDAVTINPTAGELTLDYVATGTGTSDITVSATDTEGAIVETTFNVTVKEDVTPAAGSSIKVEAESYIQGTNGVEYFDNSTGNNGGASGFTDDVDVSVNPAGGFYISYINTDEYLSYDFTVAANGFYDLVVRAATKRDNRSIQVTIDEQSYTVAIPNTGGWETWQDVIIPNVVLNAGTTTMRVDMKSPGLNLDFFELDPLEEILVI